MYNLQILLHGSFIDDKASGNSSQNKDDQNYHRHEIANESLPKPLTLHTLKAFYCQFYWN